MAGTNDFLPTAVGSGSYVSTTASWSASARRQTGFQSGIVPGGDFNKALRQPSVMASVLGSFIAAQNLDALDDGNLAALLANFQAALVSHLESNIGLPIPASLVHRGTATGGPSAYTVAGLTPGFSTLSAGTILLIEFPAANTGPASLTFSGLSPALTRTIVRMDGSALKQSDIVAGDLALSVRADGRLGILNYNPLNAPLRNSIAFRSSGNFTVPEGCYFIYAQAWGAGGGGGGAVHNNGSTAGAAGAGGGGGGYDDGFFLVTPGQTLTITVGIGGVGGNGSSSGGAGGPSSVGTLISATGGGGGAGALNALQGNGNGQGGQGVGGSINALGASGGTAFTVTPGSAAGASGGIGGAAPFGGSSPSLNVGAGSSNPGNFPGGGANAGANNTNGGAGAPGLVRISF